MGGRRRSMENMREEGAGRDRKRRGRERGKRRGI